MNLELVVFWSRELLVTDVAVLVFVVVAEDFLNQVSLLLEELLNVLRLVPTLRFDLLNLEKISKKILHKYSGELDSKAFRILSNSLESVNYDRISCFLVAISSFVRNNRLILKRT